MKKIALSLLAVGGLLAAPSAMAAAKKPAAKPAAKAAAKKGGDKMMKKGTDKLSWDDATSIGGKIGTLGLGLELSKPINDNWNARFGINYWSKSDDRTEGGVRYDGDLRLNSYAFLADYHGKNHGFRGTVGFMINANNVDLDANVGAAGVALGAANNLYTPAVAGTTGRLDADVDFNTFAPYLGIGYGNPFSKDERDWTFSLDLGVLFQGDPDVSLGCSNLATAVAGATLAADCLAEQRQLNQDLDDFDIYPVISVGAAYRF